MNKDSKKIGVIFGTYAPMHIGHVDLIQRAKRENDEVVVVVSGTNTSRDRGTNIGLNLNRRFRYVREVFKDDELINIEKLDEENMPEYPNGWQIWLKKLHEIISNVTKNNFQKLTFYVGEEEYCKPLSNYFKDFTEQEVVLVERTIIPISATEIRNNPLNYWKYITKPFCRHFTKKILVIGSASGGKTTLVKDLGRLFNAQISLEYAREYQTKYGVKDFELDVQDFVRLFVDQYAQTSDVIDSGTHSGIVIADTNSAVTMAYVKHYLKGKISDKEYKMLHSLFESTLDKEQWDLVLLISPCSDYIDDNFRDMTMAEQHVRKEFTQTLIKLMSDKFKDKLFILESKDKNTFFIDNYNKSKKLITKKLGINI